MNDTLNIVAALLKTRVCNVRIVKHSALNEREDNTYTVELMHDNGRDWLNVGSMNRGRVTLIAPDKYSKVDYPILAMYRLDE